MTESLENIIQWTFIVAGLLGSTVAFILTKRDRDATTYSTLADTVTTLSEEVRHLQTDVSNERTECRRLQEGVRILVKQLRRLGIEPEWTP